MGSDVEKDSNEKKPREKFTVRTPTDIQRIKLQKLMDNPTKEVIIPTQRKRNGEFGSDSAPSFVRNVMGSSAGAGSGEFHVYRHLRRKEYARQKSIQQKSKQEELDDEFHNRLEKNRLTSEQKTAKKRAKRLKKKQKAKVRKPNPNVHAATETVTTSDESDEDENDDKSTNDQEHEKQLEKTDEPEQESCVKNDTVNSTNTVEELVSDGSKNLSDKTKDVDSTAQTQEHESE